MAIETGHESAKRCAMRLGPASNPMPTITAFGGTEASGMTFHEYHGLIGITASQRPYIGNCT
jgi:hypothetical protein